MILQPDIDQEARTERKADREIENSLEAGAQVLRDRHAITGCNPNKHKQSHKAGGQKIQHGAQLTQTLHPIMETIRPPQRLDQSQIKLRPEAEDDAIGGGEQGKGDQQATQGGLRPFP